MNVDDHSKFAILFSAFRNLLRPSTLPSCPHWTQQCTVLHTHEVELHSTLASPSSCQPAATCQGRPHRCRPTNCRLSRHPRGSTERNCGVNDHSLVLCCVVVCAVCHTECVYVCVCVCARARARAVYQPVDKWDSSARQGCSAVQCSAECAPCVGRRRTRIYR